jgi:AraC family transcriptional regulator
MAVMLYFCSVTDAIALSSRCVNNYVTTYSFGFFAIVIYHCNKLRTKQNIFDGLPSAKLQQAVDFINEHLGENLSLTEIAAQVDMSQFYFCRLFKQSVGMTPHKYLIQQRVERAKSLLKQREYEIVDIAADCGFANPSHFAKCFRQYTGVSPQQFRSI